MREVLFALGHELAKDKWAIFLLDAILLWAYIHTKNDALLQLLVTGVGGFIGLMRTGSQQQNIASGEGSTVKTEPKS